MVVPSQRDNGGAWWQGAIPPGILLQQATEQLQQQAGAPAVEPRRGAEPAHQMYGVFGPQYAASLARPTGAAGADILNRTALGLEADQEQEAYNEALINAQAGAERLEALEQYGPIEVARINNEREALFRGSSDTQIGPDGLPRVTYDAIPTTLENQIAGNREVAATRKDNAGAVRDYYESGFSPSPGTAAGYMTHPAQQELDQYDVFNTQRLNPDDQTARDQLPIDWYEAESGRITAEAARLRAETGQDDVDLTVVTDPNTGMPLRREYRGSPGAVERTVGDRRGGGQQQQPQMNSMIRARDGGGREVGQAQDGSVVFLMPSGRHVAIRPDGSSTYVEGPPSGGE